MNARSRRAFIEHLQRIIAKGCEDLGGEWEGVHAPRKLRCAKGHEATTRPHDIRKGWGVCRTCAGQ